MTTAEWECTVCHATNRRLVADDAARAEDRCVTCRTKHAIERNDRPVRWNARAVLRKSP